MVDNNEDIKTEEVETTEEATETVEASEVSEAAEGESVEAKDPNFKWYIGKTLTGQENKVQKTLRERIVNYQLTEFFGEIVVPEEKVVTHAGGKKRTITKKLFPGYVLINMIMNDKTWHLVKDTDKITGFVGGTMDNPQPLTDEEAAYMTGQSTEGYKKTRTNVDFSEGEQVKVTEGPFASFVGTIEAVSDKGKLKVNVSIFGRPTPVELDCSQVEKIG